MVMSRFAVTFLVQRVAEDYQARVQGVVSLLLLFVSSALIAGSMVVCLLLEFLLWTSMKGMVEK